jgi:4-hydroxybenzoate polyprenyltransferase
MLLHCCQRNSDMALESMKPLRHKANIYYRGIRARDWFGYLGMCAVGYALGIFVTPSSAFDILLIAKSAVSCALFLAFCFSINNYADVDGDRLDPAKVKKNPVASGMLSPREALALSAAIALCGLAIAVTMANLVSLGFYLFLVLLGWAYSVPPLRLKGRPVADVVSHGLMLGVLLFLFGHSAATPELFSQEAILVSASIFTSSVIFELRNHLSDIVADSISGTLTTVGWLGEKASKRLILAVTAVDIVLLTAFLFMSTNLAIYLAPAAVLLISPLVLTGKVSPERGLDFLTVGVYLVAVLPRVIMLFVT